MADIASHRGVTSTINENIMPTIKTKTKLKDSTIPFKITKVNFFCDRYTDIYINASSDDISEGISKAFVKETFAGSGEYVLATSIQDIVIGSFVVSEPGTSYEITFLY